MRPPDWRTLALAVAGAAVLGALPLRWSDPRDLLLLTAWCAALLVLAATDLDQRLLPDVITLPLIPLAFVAVVLGWDPLLAGKSLALPSAIAAGAGAPLVLALTDRLLRGGLGIGDLKLAASLGLVSGVSRLVSGLLLASIASGIVLVALIAARRIGLRTAIPFGPILIVAGFVAAVLA